jgi:hypothetical protein
MMIVSLRYPTAAAHKAGIPAVRYWSYDQWYAARSGLETALEIVWRGGVECTLATGDDARRILHAIHAEFDADERATAWPTRYGHVYSAPRPHDSGARHLPVAR